MNTTKIRTTALVAALAAVTATAWAQSDTFTSVYRAAHTLVADVPGEKDVATAPNEQVVPTPDTMAAPSDRPAPVAEPVVQEPRVIVQEKAMTLDERIQANVIDRIAMMPNVSGKVGVESNDAVVTLTGLVTTEGQAFRIQKVAYSVEGVRRVDNRIRAKIGGSV